MFLGLDFDAESGETHSLQGLGGNDILSFSIVSDDQDDAIEIAEAQIHEFKNGPKTGEGQSGFGVYFGASHFESFSIPFWFEFVLYV